MNARISLGMNRAQVEDRIGYCRRELEALERIQADMGCRSCGQFKADAVPECKKYGPVPADFIAQGCDEWEYDDCPF